MRTAAQRAHVQRINPYVGRARKLEAGSCQLTAGSWWVGLTRDQFAAESKRQENCDNRKPVRSLRIGGNVRMWRDDDPARVSAYVPRFPVRDLRVGDEKDGVSYWRRVERNVQKVIAKHTRSRYSSGAATTVCHHRRGVRTTRSNLAMLSSARQRTTYAIGGHDAR